MLTATSTVTTGQVGNDWNLAITTTGSGVIKLAFDISNIESSGDKFFANARFRVASGSSGFQWASTYIESNRNSTTNWVETAIQQHQTMRCRLARMTGYLKLRLNYDKALVRGDG